jgi:hypothetical protein
MVDLLQCRLFYATESCKLKNVGLFWQFNCSIDLRKRRKTEAGFIWLFMVSNFCVREAAFNVTAVAGRKSISDRLWT